MITALSICPRTARYPTAGGVATAMLPTTIAWGVSLFKGVYANTYTTNPNNAEAVVSQLVNKERTANPKIPNIKPYAYALGVEMFPCTKARVFVRSIWESISISQILFNTQPEPITKDSPAIMATNRVQ